jgi:hypothetical protein
MNTNEMLLNLKTYIISVQKEIELCELQHDYYSRNLQTRQIAGQEIQESLMNNINKVKRILIGFNKPFEQTGFSFGILSKSNDYINITNNIYNKNDWYSIKHEADTEEVFMNRKRKRSESGSNTTTKTSTPSNNERLKAFSEKTHFKYDLTEQFLDRFKLKIADSLRIVPENLMVISSSLYSMFTSKKNVIFHMEGGDAYYNDFHNLLRRHFPDGYLFDLGPKGFYFGGPYIGKAQSKDFYEELRLYLDGKINYCLTIDEYFFLEDLYNKLFAFCKPFRMKEIKISAKLFKDLEEVLKEHQD